MPSKENFKSKPGGRPRTAIELAPEGVLAAAVPQGSESPAYAFAPLPAGALVPGVAEANIHNQEAVVQAIRTAVDELAPKTPGFIAREVKFLKTITKRLIKSTLPSPALLGERMWSAEKSAKANDRLPDFRGDRVPSPARCH